MKAITIISSTPQNIDALHEIELPKATGHDLLLK